MVWLKETPEPRLPTASLQCGSASIGFVCGGIYPRIPCTGTFATSLIIDAQCSPMRAGAPSPNEWRLHTEHCLQRCLGENHRSHEYITNLAGRAERRRPPDDLGTFMNRLASKARNFEVGFVLLPLRTGLDAMSWLSSGSGREYPKLSQERRRGANSTSRSSVVRCRPAWYPRKAP